MKIRFWLYDILGDVIDFLFDLQDRLVPDDHLGEMVITPNAIKGCWGEGIGTQSSTVPPNNHEITSSDGKVWYVEDWLGSTDHDRN